MHGEQTQPREDMIPMMDGLKEYLGMIHNLPDFVQINRVRILAICATHVKQKYLTEVSIILNLANTALNCWVFFPECVNICLSFCVYVNNHLYM